ncbi:AAA family ATPase [Polycladidibacter hongkongensis]|uniref:AAA family ATPase n=1 Tax=Polycladidibacter hongkongensis TaxID=1647556 RepID=UPI0009EB03A1|nr:AAA family ATPase [Pseudovibrio hongkongensis]
MSQALENMSSELLQQEIAPGAGVDLQTVSLPRISIQAFCETKEQADILEAAARDRRMSRTHTNVYGGGILAAVEYYATAATPNLLVVETLETGTTLFEQLGQLAEVCDPGTRVMVIGSINDVDLYRALIDEGVSEYLVGPLSIQKLITTFARFFASPDAEPIGRTIAVLGAKGGSGASTVAHNLSWAISRSLENDVAIVDLDLPFGTAGLDFNQDPLQTVWDAINTDEELEKTYVDRLLAKCSDRVRLLAAPAILDKAYDYHADQFLPLVEVMKESSPVVVLDIPHAWNEWTRRTIAAADEVVIVAEPDLANLRNAKNLTDALAELRPNDQKPLLVLNKVGVAKRPEIKSEEFSGALETPVAAQFAFDAHLFGSASTNGQMVADVEPKGGATRTFEELAMYAMGRTTAKLEKKSGIGALLGKLKKK